MTERNTLEAAIRQLESQREILGDEVVDTSIVAIKARLAQSPDRVLRSNRLASALLVISVPPSHPDLNLISNHIRRCIERQQGKFLLADDALHIAVFQYRELNDNAIELAIRAAQSIETTPKANRATRSLIPVMRIAIHAVFLRDSIEEAHDLLAHLHNSIQLVRNTLNQTELDIFAEETTTVLISDEAYDVAQDIVRIGKTLRFADTQWYVFDSLKNRANDTISQSIQDIESVLIDRTAELGLLQSRYRETIQDRKCHVVAIAGVLGVGKTRLLTEYEVWIDLLIEKLWFFKGETTLGQSQTSYSLFRQVFQRRFDITDDDAPAMIRKKLVEGIQGFVPEFSDENALMIGHLIGLDIGSVPLPAQIYLSEKFQRDTTFPIIGDFFKQVALCKDNVLSLIIEDLHNADAESLDLLAYVLETCRDAPIICVCTMRPTIFEQHNEWTTRFESCGATYDLIELRSMSEAAGRKLLDEVLQRRVIIPPIAAQKIIKQSAGNPFQLEVLIHLLIEEGIINTSTIPWQFDEHQFLAIEIPSTLVGILQARLFDLSNKERITLQRAATIGFQFWDTTLIYLQNTMSPTSTSNISQLLSTLEKKQIISKLSRTDPQYGSVYCFKHVLWHTVAYESLPLQVLHGLHTALAQWYIGKGLDETGKNANIVAKHFELAGDHARAIKWYGMAGRKAQEYHQPSVAAKYYQYALDLLPDDSSNLDVLMQLYEGLGESLAMLTLYTEAATLYSAMCATAETVGNALAQAHAWNRLVEIEIHRSDTVSAMNCAIQAMNAAEMAGADGELELATAWYHIGYVYMSRHHADDAEEWLQKGLTLSNKLNQILLTARIQNSLGHFYVHKNDYSNAIHCFEQSIEQLRTSGNIVNLSDHLAHLAEVFRQQGDYVNANTLLTEALQIAEQIRSRKDMVFCMSNLAGVEIRQGQPQRAKNRLEHVLEMALPDGWWGIVGTYRYLSEANLALGANEDALETAYLMLDWAKIRDIPSDLGIAWRILGMVATSYQDGITVEEQSFTPEQCFQKSCAYLEDHNLAELAETYRVWGSHEFSQQNDIKGTELWQKARQSFTTINASFIIDQMNSQHKF